MARSSAYLRPDVLARIANLGLRARRVVEGAVTGMHRSPLHGQSVEFADYREYAPGDDLKQLDWRVFARSDRYYIKRFEEESNLRCDILLDASASMKYRGDRQAMSKFEYAATIAAALATLLIKQRDAAGLALFDASRRSHLRPASTQAQLLKIIDALESAKPDRDTEIGEVLRTSADQFRRRGMVVIISDLLTDLDALHDGLHRLNHQGQETILLHLLDPDELDLPFEGSVQFHALEGSGQMLAEPRFFRQAYRDAMQDFCRETERRARLAGIDYQLIRTDEDLGLALSHYLHVRQRMSQRPASPGRAGGRT